MIREPFAKEKIRRAYNELFTNNSTNQRHILLQILQEEIIMMAMKEKLINLRECQKM